MQRSKSFIGGEYCVMSVAAARNVHRNSATFIGRRAETIVAVLHVRDTACAAVLL